MSPREFNDASAAREPLFATTHWSLVLAVRDRGGAEATQALAQLCETYWYPLYAYARRRVGDVHEARDLTQAFYVRTTPFTQLVRSAPMAVIFCNFAVLL